jgi:hypothetical protein
VISQRLIHQQALRNRRAMDQAPQLEPVESIRRRVLEEMAAAPPVPHDGGSTHEVRFLSEGPEQGPP